MKIGDYEVIVVDKDEALVGCQRVRREELEEILDLMNHHPELCVGDFVRITNQTLINVNLEGQEFGKIVAKDPGWWGVEFPKASSSLHDLNGRTKNKHGYWIEAENLEGIE